MSNGFSEDVRPVPLRPEKTILFKSVRSFFSSLKVNVCRYDKELSHFLGSVVRDLSQED